MNPITFFDNKKIKKELTEPFSDLYLKGL